MDKQEGIPVSVLRNRRASAQAVVTVSPQSSCSPPSSPQATPTTKSPPTPLSFFEHKAVDDDTNSASSRKDSLQEEFRKLNHIASVLAMAMTESHQSDEDTTGSRPSNEDDDELASDVDDLHDLLDPQSPVFLGSPTRSLARTSKLLQTDDAVPPPPDTFLGNVEALDKRVSAFIFRLEFGKVFESLMLVLGTWFGLPVPAWGLWTAFLGLLDEYASLDKHTARNTLVLVALAFLLYSANFIRWLRQGKYQSVYGNLKQLMAVPILFAIVFSYGSRTRGHNAGAYFVVCWTIAEVTGHMLKWFFKRVRPVAYLGDSIPKRHVPEVQQLFGKGHTAFESFPSADTIGGAVFSACLWQFRFVPSLLLAMALSVSIAFSRVYLQAHHVLDVAFGLALGWVTCLAMWRPFGQERLLGPIHAVVGVLFFVIVSLIARKFKHALPKHMERPKSMYGF